MQGHTTFPLITYYMRMAFDIFFVADGTIFVAIWYTIYNVTLHHKELLFKNSLIQYTKQQINEYLHLNYWGDELNKHVKICWCIFDHSLFQMIVNRFLCWRFSSDNNTLDKYGYADHLYSVTVSDSLWCYIHNNNNHLSSCCIVFIKNDNTIRYNLSKQYHKKNEGFKNSIASSCIRFHFDVASLASVLCYI